MVEEEWELEEEPFFVSSFALLGVGPAPLTAEIFRPLYEALEADVTGAPQDLRVPPSREEPLVLEIYGIYVSFWVEEVDVEVDRAATQDLRVSDEEYAKIHGSDWVLRVESQYDGEDPIFAVLAQLRIIELQRTDFVRHVVDLSSLQVWDPDHVSELLLIPDRPPMSELYGLHVVSADRVRAHLAGYERGDSSAASDEAGLWVHTHGLLRFGIPDLEIFDVAPEHVARIKEVIDAVIERLTDQPEASENPIPISPGIYGMVLGLEEILEVLPEGVIAADPEERMEDDSIDGPRMVLCGIYQMEGSDENIIHWDLGPILDVIQETGSLSRCATNTERMGALARHRLDLLRVIWAGHRTEDWRLLFKIPEPLMEEHNERGRAHQWHEIHELTEDGATGWLMSAADEGEPKLEELALDELSAFMLIIDEHRVGPAQLPKLARHIARRLR